MPIELASVAKKVSLINISGEISSEKSIDASGINYEINVIGSSQGVCFILIRINFYSKLLSNKLQQDLVILFDK